MSRILVIDDNEMLVELFTTILLQAGHEVCSASDGRTGLGLAEKEIPDLVFLDILLDPGNGWEVLGHIRACAATSAVPVAILSGRPPTQEELDRFGQNIDHYLQKPFSAKELIQSADEITGDYRDLDNACRASVAAGIGPLLVEEFSAVAAKALKARRMAKTMAAGNLRPSWMTGEDHVRLVELTHLLCRHGIFPFTGDDIPRDPLSGNRDGIAAYSRARSSG